MRFPAIHGIIDRRVLVNFRVDPSILSALCPDPFRPHVINGFGMAGICLIRLKQMRPRWVPASLGFSSENAAHRIAVEWGVGTGRKCGVYVPRRDSSSWFNVLSGGRLFSGVHHHARFDCVESNGNYHIAMDSDDGSANVSLTGRVCSSFPADSVFDSLEECSSFYQAGSLGYSPSVRHRQFDGLELRTIDWQVQPLQVSHVRSSFFEDCGIFPAGSAVFDNALLMRNIHHEWHSRGTVCCTDALPAAQPAPTHSTCTSTENS